MTDIIVALDYPEAKQALDFASKVHPSQCKLKIGSALFTRAGPTLVEKLIGRGFDVFLDLKFHDTPKTVALACHAAADLGVWMVDVHCLGGERMLEAARKAMDEHAKPPLLVGVTILTSMTHSDLSSADLGLWIGDKVLRLAHLAKRSWFDGVICSPQETAELRRTFGEDFLLVTPGIRPAGTDLNDQRRVMTPADARKEGADYLVIGRPITESLNPVTAMLELTR